MKNFDYDTFVIYLEQKNLFMKDILNITKRIEVEAKQEEVILDELLSERQNRIDRIIKCDKAIGDVLDALDESDREHLKSVLKGDIDSADTPEAASIAELVSSTQDYLKRTLEIDKSATNILFERREEARKMLVEISEEQRAAEEE